MVAVVVTVGVLTTRPTVPPEPTPSGSLPPVAVADLPPAEVDGQVIDDDLAHDSRDDLYRTPFGAVPAGTAVTLRLRAAAGDLSAVTIRVWDSFDELQALVPMAVAATDTTAGEHGYDYWEATLRTPGNPTVLYYRFIAADGPTVRYVEDDPPIDEGNDGGTGIAYTESIDSSWQIDVYDPAFTTPEWARGALAYQIFPDRFFNGDQANDPSPDAVAGPDGADRYRYGDVYGNPVLPKAWTDLPEGYCRAYQGAGACPEDPLGRDFFGGDLRGVTDKLDDLRDLGVTVIYLNPIFAAPSNHRDDTSSYEVIDPDLGSREDFDELIAQAESRGIRVLLDGVFNHVSSDSPWFDRAGRFPEVGACESAESIYRAWFTFRAPGPNEPAPCAPTSASSGDTYYQGWFGFDTIPEIIERTDVYDLTTGPDGVVRRWIEAGTAGWRLDVMDDMSHGFMRRIREAVKSTDPDALVLGEQWGDTSAWLLGDEADSTMNYRFRRAVIGLLNGQTADLDGAIGALTPSEFAARMDGVREDYPAAAWDVLFNLVDSHDTTRILWTLTPGAENPGDKEDPTNLAVGKAKLRLLAALQLTWPGMSSVYYGTEAGLTGQDDPDDRRPYPWDAIDTDLRDWYRALGQLRAGHEALRLGDLRFVNADDADRTLAFARRTDTEAAVTVLNLSAEARDVVLALSGIVPAGTILTDELGDLPDAVVGGDGTATVSIEAGGAAVFVSKPGLDLVPPGAPDGLSATAAPGQVELVWSSPATGDAVTHRIWRSLVSGGGYTLIGETSGVYFVDATVRNGTGYHYVITALDEVGNDGPRSPEADALPALTLADARLTGPRDQIQPLSAVEPGAEIAAMVDVENVTDVTGPTIGIVAQLGFGRVRADSPEDGFVWSDMAFDADVEGADRFVGSVRPTELGAWNVVLRVSTDGRRTWTFADARGLIATPYGYDASNAVTLVTVSGADVQAPPVPQDVVVRTVTPTSLTLAWTPVVAPDLFRYEVSRGPTGSGPFELIGSSIEPTFTDSSVDQGDAYTYVVTAVDASFNRSVLSRPVAAEIQQRVVQVTLTVTVPGDTPSGDTVYIAGDFQDWDPGATPMTKVDDATWTITVPFSEGDPPQYKYTRGTWDAVEMDEGCGEIPNRAFDVTFGADGMQGIADSVAKWHDVAACG